MTHTWSRELTRKELDRRTWAEEQPEDWEPATRSRCFVHIANSLTWCVVTSEAPLAPPPTAADYTSAGLPWFGWYDDKPALEANPVLAKLTSVHVMGQRRGEVPLPENDTFEPSEPVVLQPRRGRPLRPTF